jgi:hypothetical protein
LYFCFLIWRVHNEKKSGQRLKQIFFFKLQTKKKKVLKMSAMEVTDDEDRSGGEEISTPPESAPQSPSAQVRLLIYEWVV